MPGGGQGAPAGGAVEAPSRPETRRPGGQLGPRRTGPSGRLGKAAREHPGQGPLPLPPGEAFGPGLLKGAEGRVPGAERRELAHFAHTQRDPRLSAHSPGLYTPLPKADWKKNVFGTWGSAALEKAGSDSSRKAVQAGSSLTPSHPASTTPVPAAKTPLQAGLRRPGGAPDLHSLCPKLPLRSDTCRGEGRSRRYQPSVVKGEDGGQSPGEQDWNFK